MYSQKSNTKVKPYQLSILWQNDKNYNQIGNSVIPQNKPSQSVVQGFKNTALCKWPIYCSHSAYWDHSITSAYCNPIHVFIYSLPSSSGESDSDSGSSSSENASDTDEASGPTHPFADLSRGDPTELLAQLREMGDMDYSLTWIQRCLNRTAEDREDGMLDMMLTPMISITITFHSYIHVWYLLYVFQNGTYFHPGWCWIQNRMQQKLNQYETRSMGVNLHGKLLVMLPIYVLLNETTLLPMPVSSKLVTSTNCCYPLISM